MRAIVRETSGGPEQLVVREVSIPVPGDGEVRINVKAFGINRAETYMRRGTWGDVASISGIECVGVVDADPPGRLRPGQTVAAIMGGLGRTRGLRRWTGRASPARGSRPQPWRADVP